MQRPELMADLMSRREWGGREWGERSSIIVHTLAAQSRGRARQDRARVEWAWVAQFHNFYKIPYQIAMYIQRLLSKAILKR